MAKKKKDNRVFIPDEVELMSDGGMVSPEAFIQVIQDAVNDLHLDSQDLYVELHNFYKPYDDDRHSKLVLTFRRPETKEEEEKRKFLALSSIRQADVNDRILYERLKKKFGDK